jgi:aspartate/tyrosine/aromatic aminotransferase
MRPALKNTIEHHVPGFDAAFLAQQNGMFSCLPITLEEQRVLERDFHIYMLPPARVNVAAMNNKQSQTLAEAFKTVRENRLGDQRTG